MVIPVFNIETAGLEKSYLSNPYSAGVTSIEVKNNNRFSANDRIMIGEMGNEGTEIVTVSAVNANGTTVTTGTTLFAHSADDPVYQMPFDQVKFYRSTTTADGTYAVISTQNMDVDNSDMTTKYDDTTGVSTYFYKFTFYHSVSTVESAFSDVIGGAGWRREQVGYIIDTFLQEVGDQNEQHVTRSEILGWFNDVNDDLQINVSRPYEFLKARTTLNRTANRNYIDYPVDANDKQSMWAFDYMDYNFTDSSTSPVTDRTYTLRVIPEPEFRNLYQDNTIDATTVSDEIQIMCLDASVNRFRFDVAAATSANNVFYLHYWKYFDDIISEGQIVETPTPKIYKLYCKLRFYQKRALADPTLESQSRTFGQEYQVEKLKYSGINNRDKGTPRGFRPRSTTQSIYRR